MAVLSATKEGLDMGCAGQVESRTTLEFLVPPTMQTAFWLSKNKGCCGKARGPVFL